MNFNKHDIQDEINALKKCNECHRSSCYSCTIRKPYYEDIVEMLEELLNNI